MATKILAQFQDGVVRAEVDYNDTSLRISAVRVVNNSDEAAHITIVETSSGRVRSQRFPAQNTTFIEIPTTGPASERLTYTLNADGKLDGISFEILWPYP